MQRMIRLFCDQLMCFDTHHDIRGFDTDHKIIIAHIFDQFHFIHCALHNSLCGHTMVFFHKTLL